MPAGTAGRIGLAGVKLRQTDRGTLRRAKETDRVGAPVSAAPGGAAAG